MSCRKIEFTFFYLSKIRGEKNYRLNDEGTRRAVITCSLVQMRSTAVVPGREGRPRVDLTVEKTALRAGKWSRECYLIRVANIFASRLPSATHGRHGDGAKLKGPEDQWSWMRTRVNVGPVNDATTDRAAQSGRFRPITQSDLDVAWAQWIPALFPAKNPRT